MADGGPSSDDPAKTARSGEASAAKSDEATAEAKGDDEPRAHKSDEAEATDDEAGDEEGAHEADDARGKRRPVVVIDESEEDEEEDERASPVEGHEDEKPPSVNGAILGGLVGSLIGAAVWWGLIRVSGYQLGLVAIGVGILSGLGVVGLGGRSSTNQIIGAACGLVGILIGKVLFYYFGLDELQAQESAKATHTSVEMARMHVRLLHENGSLTLGSYMKDTMQAMDILFFGIGMYEGWRIPRPNT